MDWNQPAPDGSGKPLMPTWWSTPSSSTLTSTISLTGASHPTCWGAPTRNLIKKFADDAGAKAGEFFLSCQGVPMPKACGLCDVTFSGTTEFRPNQTLV